MNTPADPPPETASGSPLFIGMLVGALMGLVAGIFAGQQADVRAVLGLDHQTEPAALAPAPRDTVITQPTADEAQAPSLATPFMPSRPAQQAAWLGSIGAALDATDALVALSAPPAIAAGAEPVVAEGFWQGLFQIRKTTQAPDAFYRAEFYAVTREQVRLRLLSARLSVQLLDHDMAAADLAASRDLMVRFFDPQSAPLAELLTQLEAVEAELRNAP
jgi:hypothetical protein